MCPCRLPHASGSLALAASSTPTGQPQRKPAEQMCHACSGVLPAVVEWQIVDLTVVRRWRLVVIRPSGTVGWFYLVNAYEMHAGWLIPFVDKRAGGR